MNDGAPCAWVVGWVFCSAYTRRRGRRGSRWHLVDRYDFDSILFRADRRGLDSMQHFVAGFVSTTASVSDLLTWFSGDVRKSDTRRRGVHAGKRGR